MYSRFIIFISLWISYSLAAYDPLGSEDAVFPGKLADLKNYICWAKSSLLGDFFPHTSKEKQMFNIGVAKRIGGIDFADYFDKNRLERERQEAAAAAAAAEAR